MIEEIILVDSHDREIGFDEKLSVHVNGRLHRAFSVFIFRNNLKQMLLQKRAATKYHSSGMWTNACCSHPRKDESLDDAVSRRLNEELGILCSVNEMFQFHYRAEFDNKLIENEIDHVFFAEYDGLFDINEEEIESIRWISLDNLQTEIEQFPERFTPWFLIAWDKIRFLLKTNV